MQNIRNNPAFIHAVDAVMADIEREARKGHRFDDYEDLVDHDLRTRGYVTARKVA